MEAAQDQKPSSIKWEVVFLPGVLGTQTVILPALNTWHVERAMEYCMGEENCCACSLLTAVGADTNMNNPWTASQNESVCVVAKCDQV